MGKKHGTKLMMGCDPRAKENNGTTRLTHRANNRNRERKRDRGGKKTAHQRGKRLFLLKDEACRS